MKNTLLVGWFLIILSLITSSCDSSKLQPVELPPDKVTVEISGKNFTLELAVTEPVRTRGLMYRDSMPDDAGMIFVFKGEKIRSFWMGNVKIDLDILYLDSEGTIVSHHTMKAEKPRGKDESEEAYLDRMPGYGSIKPARYAIELNAGKIKELGLKVGDKIDIPKSSIDYRAR